MNARRRVSGSDATRVTIRGPLFTRFETDAEIEVSDVARDLADLLGARRALARDVPGVLGFGLPSVSGMAPGSHSDRMRAAAMLARAIEQFEPRLEQVQVVPDGNMTDFTFRIEAVLVQPEEARSIRLRVLSPRRGGGLSAEVEVIGD